MIQLIEPVIPGLRRYARALVRDASDADDLVQDCLERAIGRWSQRRPESDARSWLFTILHNLAISRWRQIQRRGPLVAFDSLNESMLASPPEQHHNLDYDDVMRSLAALPPEFRAVVLLITVEELTYAQAAQVLGVPVGTVMSRLSRGRARLAQLMAGRDGAMSPYLRRVK